VVHPRHPISVAPSRSWTVWNRSKV